MDDDMIITAIEKGFKNQFWPGKGEEPAKGMIYIPRIFLIISLFCSHCSAVTVSLDCSFYNSEDQMAVSLDGENFDFSGSVLLESDSLYYSNGGSSTQPDCSYSYSIVFNGEPLQSGAKSDSGNFSWHATAGSNMWHQEISAFKLSNTHRVKDGTMRTFDANVDHRVDEVIAADGSSYSVSTKMTPDVMDLKGRGSNNEPAFSYSYAQTLDDELIGSSAESSAGGAAWRVNVTTVGRDDEEQIATIFAKDFVENGSLTSSFFNSDHLIEETAKTDKAYFVESANITHDAIEAAGRGGSRLPEFLYSYAQIFDGDILGANVSSTSGKAGWSANASSEGDGSKAADIEAWNLVENGSLESEYFNNDHRIEETIIAESANYTERAKVVSSELNAKGIGFSAGFSWQHPLNTEFRYSYNQTLDNKSIGLGAQGASANGWWFASASANGEGDGFNSAKVLATNNETNGSLKTFYFNPNLSVKDYVEALDARSTQWVNVSEEKMAAKTAGSTITAQNNTDDERGAWQQIQVNGPDRSGQIETGVMGDTEAYWKSEVISDLSQYSFGMGLMGRGSLLDLHPWVAGQITGLPVQVLPGMDVVYQYGNGAAVDEEKEISDGFYRMNMTFEVKNQN
jgi:hypothetical protein